MTSFQLHIRAAWAARNLAALPDQPGIYAFSMEGDAWLRSKGIFELEPARALARVEGRPVLYVGATCRSLQVRLFEHLIGCAYASTLRRSLACLLAEELDLHPHGGPSLKLDSGEARLNEWIASNLWVSTRVCGDPVGAEREIVRATAPPLNLHDGKLTPFGRAVRAMRSDMVRAPTRPTRGSLDRHQRLAAYGGDRPTPREGGEMGVAPPQVESSPRRRGDHPPAGQLSTAIHIHSHR